jgi:hypothetical protein
MTLHNLSPAIPVLLIILGLVLLIRAAASPAPGSPTSFMTRPRLRPRVSAQQLGLAHRLVARILRSHRRPGDDDFVFLERYTLAVDTRALAMVTPLAFWAAVDAGRPLLELEQLLESLEEFTRRVSTWRPGRKRGQS